MSAYADGELDEQRRAHVEAHLRDCWGCSGDLELNRLLKRSLRNLAIRQADTLAVMRLQRFVTRLAD